MEYGKITMPSHTEALEKRVDFLSEEIERLHTKELE